MGNKEQDNNRKKVVAEILINHLGANISFFKDLLQKQEGEPAYELCKETFVDSLTIVAECSCLSFDVSISKQEIKEGIIHLLGIESELAPVK